jgi:O-antigen/teichoic acid export membrane protein
MALAVMAGTQKTLEARPGRRPVVRMACFAGTERNKEIQIAVLKKGYVINKLFSSPFRRNVSSGMLTNGISFIVAMVSYPIYLHFLGYEKYGIWLVLTAVLSLAQLGNLGIGPAVTKFVAEYHERGDTKAVSRYVTTALITLSISGSAILLIILSLRTQIISLFKLSPESATLALWLLPYVGVLSLYIFIVRTTGSTLSGLGRIDLLNYSNVISRVVAVAVSTTLLYTGHGIESLLIAYFVSECMAHAFYVVVIRKMIGMRYWRIRDFDTYSLQKMVGLGSALMGGTMLGMLLAPFNKMMISRFIGVGAIPIYEIAYNTSLYVRDLVASGLGALTPEMSRLSGSVNVDAVRIRHIYHTSMKLILLLGIPLFIAVFALATPLLEVWLQQRFNPLLPMAFRIMLLGSFLSLTGIPAFYSIIGFGHSRKIFLSQLIQTGTNVLVVTGIVVFSSGMLSINGVVAGVMLGMGLTTLYLIKQFYSSVNSIAFAAGIHE